MRLPKTRQAVRCCDGSSFVPSTAPQIVLETERLRLRHFHSDDDQALLAVFDDDYARQFYPDMADVSNAQRWVAKNNDRYETDGFGLWAMCLRETGELVGDCGLTVQAVEEAVEVEIGYHVRADWRGRGLATEASLACMRHGFGTLAANRLVSMVHPRNTASMAVAKRIHRRTRRFERLGDLYHLFYTDRDDWLGTHRT